MGQAISEVMPFAIGIAISPIPIIAVILMLFTERARANGTAFLLGWVVGLAALAAAVYAIADAADVGTSDSASDSASTVRMVLGVVLVAAALRRWRRRPPAGATPVMPEWMQGVERFTPGKAGGLGVVLGTVNPKNLLLAFGASTGLAQLNPSTGDAAVALAVFVVLASSTVAAAVTYRVFGGERSRSHLDGAKEWLSTHNDAVLAVLFLVFGVVLLSGGLGRLSA